MHVRGHNTVGCRALIALATILALGRAVHALDVIVPGQITVVTAAKLAKIRAGTSAMPLPAPGSVQDPTLHGGHLRLFDTDDALGIAGGEFSHPLPAAGWRALGTPAGSAGYVYRGSAAGDAVCRMVRVNVRGIRVVCNGAAITVSPPFRGAQGVILGVPSVSESAAIRYCAEFGGETRRNDDGRLIRRHAPAPAVCPTQRPAPNFIVVNLDDTRFDGVDLMPRMQQRLGVAGVTFHDAFVPNPSCCPSRASLFTGLYSVHHGTRAAGGLLGGADTFRQSGADQQTLAVWLHAAGYMTGLFGKYLNDYGDSEANQGPGGAFYIPPGWDRWRAQVGIEAYGGVHGRTYEIVDESRTRTVYDDHSSDAQYGTDLLARWAREFIAEAVAAQRPFFAYWSPYASHGDPILPAPAARHYGSLEGLSPWRPPSFNELDLGDKPRWLRRLMPSPLEPGFTDFIRKRAYESLLAVDEQLALILDQLAALGIEDHTVVILTSDNGATWGEHRMFAQLKGAPYEECIRVPMVVRYPRGQQAGTAVDAPVLNIDVAPTLLALSGIPQPAAVDGRSFAGWLGGPPGPPPRGDFLLEHFRLLRGHGLSYGGQVADGDQVVVFHGDTLARPRPSTRFEFDANGAASVGAVAVPIGAGEDASFAQLRSAIEAAIPVVQATHNPTTNQLGIHDRLPNLFGTYLRADVDQRGVMSEIATLPDYVGVRDVAGGYTYAEYESNEVELYDLDADPWQLENRAADPAYAAVRAQLADRLRALLGQP